MEKVYVKDIGFCEVITRVNDQYGQQYLVKTQSGETKKVKISEVLSEKLED